MNRPLAQLRVRRFSGLFWPIFDCFRGGHIRKWILPPRKQSKSRLKRTRKSTEPELRKRSDEELLACFERGLIPGPQESEEAFEQRVQQALTLSHPEWNEAAPVTRSLWGFAIDWVPLSYSSHKLSWWEGAATWIGSDLLPSIQLRPAFEKGSFLGYRRLDILAHEALHAARMRFAQPRFEEMLAYRTSPQRWKRFLGPAFQSRWMPYLLLLSLLSGIYHPVAPLLLISLGLSLLYRRHLQFRRCLRQFPLPVVLCMTDAEILSCAWKTDDSLRSRLIGLLLKVHENEGIL